MSRIHLLARAGIVLALVTVVACSDPWISTAPTDDPAPASISINGFKYSPATLTVQPGTTVTWTNDEDSLHTVTAGTPDAPTGLFDTGEIDTGVMFSFSFSEAGTYPFFCARHDFMRGEITVAP